MSRSPHSTCKYAATVVSAAHASTKLLAVLLSASLLVYGEGNTFTRVRYNGGSVASKVDPKDWDNKLTVTSDAVTLDFKDGQKLVIPPKSITSLSYGQEAHRRVGTMVTLAILVAPVALFGLFHKTRLHYIGIQYSTPDTKNAGILLQGDKDNYRAILLALQGVTGAPVSVAEKDREFVPVGVTTAVAKDSQEPDTSSLGQNTKSAVVAVSPTPAESIGTVIVVTHPEGAEVSADGQFYGNSPVNLKLKPGKHTVEVKLSGYKNWTHEISTEAGSSANLVAEMEKAN